VGLSLSIGFCVSVSFCVLGFLRHFLQLVEEIWWEDPTSLRPRLLTRARELRDKRRKSRMNREAKPEGPNAHFVQQLAALLPLLLLRDKLLQLLAMKRNTSLLFT
jgi:hypothetical protein